MCDAYTVAHRICKRRDWKVSNLELQKILYIAQMFSLGQRGKSLFGDRVEAWAYGPVVPTTYALFRNSGNGHIREHDFFMFLVRKCDEEESGFIDEVVDATKDFQPWALVAITHRPGSAWQRLYRQGANVEITADEMAAEYRDLWAKKQ